MLGTGLVAQGAFGGLGFDDGFEPGRERPALDREVQAALAAGAGKLTIAGLPAYEFAVSLRYAHIPGANRVLRDEPIRKSFLVLFFKKERLASFLPKLVHTIRDRITAAGRIR